MNGLGNIANAGIRASIGDRCFNKAGLVIDETDAEDVKITAAVEHTVNGVFQTAFAVGAKIDLSALTVLSAKDGATLSAGAIAIPALDSGDDSVTKVYLLAAKGDTAYLVEPDVDVAAAQDDASYELNCPAGYAVFGAIKIVCDPSAGAVATFVIGTTDLSGITRQTVTFFDVAVCPANLADLATV